MRLLLRTSYWELCHDWGYGSENWVRKIKLFLSLCSSFRGLIKLCLLSLLRWADCNCSKTSWWEGDGKHPGTGKAALLIWPHWTVHGVILKSHVTHGLPSSHHSTAELKAYRPFYRGGSAHTDSSWNAELCAMTDSQDTCLLHPSQPGDAPALPWELHGHPTSVGWASKMSGCLPKAVLKGDQNQQPKQENFVLFSSSWFFSLGEAQS